MKYISLGQPYLIWGGFRAHTRHLGTYLMRGFHKIKYVFDIYSDILFISKIYPNTGKSKKYMSALEDFFRPSFRSPAGMCLGGRPAEDLPKSKNDDFFEFRGR